MTRALFALVLFLAAVTQATLIPALVPGAVLPNVVLVLVLVRTARRGLVEGFAWAATAGVLLDALALDPLGTNGLALLPVALVGELGRRRFFVSGMAFPMLLAIGSTLLWACALALTRGLAGEAWTPPESILRLATLQALLNALLVPPLYLLVGWLGRAEPERLA